MEEIIILLFAMSVYFAPTLIADNYNAKNRNMILLLNLFLGWTVWMWLICLVWAVVDQKVVRVK